MEQRHGRLSVSLVPPPAGRLCVIDLGPWFQPLKYLLLSSSAILSCLNPTFSLEMIQAYTVETNECAHVRIKSVCEPMRDPNMVQPLYR